MISRYDLVFSDYTMSFYGIRTVHVCSIVYDDYEMVDIAVNKDWVHLLYSSDLMMTNDEWEPIGETIVPDYISPEVFEEIVKGGHLGLNNLNDDLRKIRDEINNKK